MDHLWIESLVGNSSFPLLTISVKVEPTMLLTPSGSSGAATAEDCGCTLFFVGNVRNCANVKKGEVLETEHESAFFGLNRVCKPVNNCDHNLVFELAK